MTDVTKGTEVERLAMVAKGQQAMQENTGNTTNATKATAGPLNYWGWQTCTEFGFYQTCDVGSKCMYTRGLDLLADEMSFCSSDFNIKTATVMENINQTNLYYGSNTPSGSRVLWVNGEVDPWHGLSVLTALPNQPVLWVKGASHHAWTHASSDVSQQTVRDARKAIRLQVTKWLQEE